MVTDFHSHILPGIDDGAASLEDSLALLRQEADQGVTHVVATPHFYPERENLSRFLDKRERSLEQLLAVRESGMPRISLGAEVYFFPGISQAEVLGALSIRGTDHILVEMPPAPWTDSMLRELEDIRGNLGLTPIVAHVDRYISRWRTHRIPERLAQLPVLVQANASFFLRRSTGSMALRMLREGRVHLLGSDCHDPQLRPVNLGPAVERIRDSLGQIAVQSIQSRDAQIFREEN